MDSADFEAKIGQLAASLYRVDGVQTVFMFGSSARGKAVKGSDVDLLVLFKDEKSLGRGREEVSKAAAATSLFTQVLARTVGEFWETIEPSLRGELLRDGRLIFLSPPIDGVSDPMMLLAYDLRKLGQSDDLKVRNGLQTLVKEGARWMGGGYLLLNIEDSFAAENILDPVGVDHELIPALMPSVHRSSGDSPGRRKRPRHRTERK